jgi:hypothetical protein
MHGHDQKMTDDPEPIPLFLTPGWPGSDSFNLRFPRKYLNEVSALLNEHGIAHNSILEESADSTLWIEAVTIAASAGGLSALASFYKSFVNRHAHHSVKIDDHTDISGFSLKDTKELLVLRAQQQAERETSWNATLEDIKDNGDLS